MKSPEPAVDVVADAAVRAMTVGVAVEATNVREVTFWLVTSLSDATGVVVRQAPSPGVVKAHAGRVTSSSREAQLPPRTDAKEL